MKLHNDLLVFDLETTDDPTEQRRIIEVGAVLLDRRLNEVGRFAHFVNPGVPLSNFVANLCGIHPEDLVLHPAWDEVSTLWQDWLRNNLASPIKHVRLACWGAYFDIPVLRQHYARYQRAYPFSGTALDVKSLAFLWMSLSGRRTDSLGLQHVCQQMGLPTSYRWHRALEDAQATAEVLKKVVRDLGGGVFLPGEKYRYVEVKG